MNQCHIFGGYIFIKVYLKVILAPKVAQSAHIPVEGNKKCLAKFLLAKRNLRRRYFLADIIHTFYFTCVTKYSDNTK